jgi:hypothetical protein
MFIWYFGVCASLVVQLHSPLRLKAYGTIGGHILGFAAIDLFGGTIAMFSIFQSILAHLLVIVMYILIIPLIILPVKSALTMVMKHLKVEEQEAERVHDQCKDTAIDFYAMGLSFLLCQWIRGVLVFMRTDHMAGFHSNGKDHSLGETLWLTFYGIIILCLSGVLRALHYQKVKANRDDPMHLQLLDVICTTVSITAAWCLLDATNWYWLHRFAESLFVGKIMVALTWSLIFVVAVNAASALLSNAHGNVKRVIRGEFTAVGLAVGLSWEHLFDRALEDAGEFVEGARAHELWVAFLTFVLVLIVFPAWTVYMLPQHDPELRQEYGKQNLHPHQAYCDCSGDVDDEEDRDEDEALTGRRDEDASSEAGSRLSAASGSVRSMTSARDCCMKK